MKILKHLWKNFGTRLWLLATSICFVIILTANLVATQNIFIYNTTNSVLGGERRVLLSGEPSKYRYYESDYETKKEALAAANQLNEKIAEEGIILLKNDNSLPLAKNSKISVFGKNSVNLVYGGTGSGAANSSGAATVYDSLAEAGFDPANINITLRNFYSDSSASGSGRPEKLASMGDITTGFVTGETPQEKYTSAVKASYNSYNDAALVVISRIGGEGYDMPRTAKTGLDANAPKISGATDALDHYLQLDQNESDLIKEVNGKFDNVIVIINCSQAMELGFLEDGTYPNVKGALWIGSPGKTGIKALGKILSGEVNPSGRTVDTFAADFKKDPSWNNFGNNLVNNGNRYVLDKTPRMNYFVEYEEGIYIGYRYYETRGYTDGDIWYNSNVVYSFGYGMSYTTFDWTLKSSTPARNATLLKDETISVVITVKNTGPVPGKDVVQLYYSAPYTNGIEKSHVVLGGFEKTKQLAPNEEQDITVSIKVSEMASYDYNDANHNQFKGWEVEAGEYTIYLAKDSHDRDLSVKYSVDETYKYAEDTTTGKKVENRFDDVSGYFAEANQAGSTKRLMSRKDFEGTWPTTPVEADKNITKEFNESLKYAVNDKTTDPWYTDVKPTQAKKPMSFKRTTVKLYQLIDKDYDDPMWDTLLNQLAVSEMAKLIGTGNYNTDFIDSIGKPKTIDPDGPVGFTAFMGDPSVYDTCFYASACVLGATYNKDLAYEMGKMVGNEGILGNQKGDRTPYSGWYAPAMNIHRSPFGGRNWEYYSEDPLLSGKMAAKVVKGAKEKGVYTYLKHFAVNDQETSRDAGGLVTWLDEQTMREIYLKPFEIAVKEGKTTAMMSSFNRIGATWAGGSYALLTSVLRDEWGFRGMVITDYNLSSYMDTEQMIRAGGDLNLTQNKQPSISDKSATQVSLIRQATKNILYTVANSNAMNGYGEGVEYGYKLPVWVIWLLSADAGLVLAFGFWGLFIIRKTMKRQSKRITGTVK